MFKLVGGSHYRGRGGGAGCVGCGCLLIGVAAVLGSLVAVTGLFANHPALAVVIVLAAAVFFYQFRTRA